MLHQNNFKIKRGRQSGHYWVKWIGLTGWSKSSDIWRMGAYQENVGWKLPGEERLYQDCDFIEINENRIPFTKGRLYGNIWWLATIAYIIAITFYIILTYKSVTK